MREQGDSNRKQVIMNWLDNSSPGQSLPLGMLPYLTQVPRILGQASKSSPLRAVPKSEVAVIAD